ncbi:orotate phosphoribosyltransferase [Myxococcota bacterium]|nr:orotate phosphoribosyltransferase [Myxococcota bacterium]
MNADEPNRRARLLALLTSLSFERRHVVLSSGTPSTFYLDCKQTALHPEGAALIGDELLGLVEVIEHATGRTAIGVGGLTLGADPLATATSLASRRRPAPLAAFIVRKQAKGHGTGAYIEGRRNLPDGSPVVLLEDVITTGGATLEALERVRTEGLVPLGVAALVDRLAGGVERLEREGLVVRSLFCATDFPGIEAP